MADRNRNPQQALFNPRQGWPLGNRSAAGEFVQRFSAMITTPNLAPNVGGTYALTYPIAFSSVPNIQVTHNEYAGTLLGCLPGATFISGSGFSLSLFNAGSATLSGSPTFLFVVIGN